MKQLLEPPRFPPWRRCPRCSEQLAIEIYGEVWCTSAACDPRGLTLRALDRYFRQHPTEIVKGDNR